MTALDQAFIKAFSQQGASPVVLPRQSAALTAESRTRVDVPTKEAATLPISNVFRDVLATLDGPAASPEDPVNEKPPASVSSARHAKVTASASSLSANPVKEKTPVLPASPTKGRAVACDSPASSAKVEPVPQAPSRCSEGEAITEAWAADCWQTPIDMPGFVGVAESVCIAEPVALPETADTAESWDSTDRFGAARPVASAKPSDVEAKHTGRTAASPVAMAPAGAAVELPCHAVEASQHPLTGAAERPADAGIELTAANPIGNAAELPCRSDAVSVQPLSGNTLPSQVAPLSTFLAREAAPARPDFKPAWQVDRFTWPRVCRRLMAKANDEFDRLADALMAANVAGTEGPGDGRMLSRRRSHDVAALCRSPFGRARRQAGSGRCRSRPGRDLPSDSACSRRSAGTRRRSKKERRWIMRSSKPPPTA